MMLDIIGKLHPLVVHLPIGFLVMGAMMKVLAHFRLKDEVSRIMPFFLWVTFGACLVSCLTGYILHSTDSYETEIVNIHFYLALGLTACIAGLLFIEPSSWWHDSMWVFTLGMLAMTGHYGGSLTHGVDYLSISADKEATSNRGEVPLDLKTDNAYLALIAPILESKCYSCHSDQKQKGGLKLDDIKSILKGGKHGTALLAGQSSSSLLVQRFDLPLNDKEHMPPKGKPQLTSEEQKLIRWWIDKGANCNSTIEQLKPGNDILTIIEKQKNRSNISELDILQKIRPPNQDILRKLRSFGVIVNPIYQKSDYLSVNLSYCKALTSSQLLELDAIKGHIVWLKASHVQNIASLIPTLATFSNLQRLYLDHTTINDRDLPSLAGLWSLKFLNISNTDITAQGLFELKSLQNIKLMYLNGTKMQRSDFPKVQSFFPNTSIDFGGYTVPTLVSDTTRLGTN